MLPISCKPKHKPRCVDPPSQRQCYKLEHTACVLARTCTPRLVCGPQPQEIEALGPHPCYNHSAIHLYVHATTTQPPIIHPCYSDSAIHPYNPLQAGIFCWIKRQTRLDNLDPPPMVMKKMSKAAYSTPCTSACWRMSRKHLSTSSGCRAGVLSFAVR